MSLRTRVRGAEHFAREWTRLIDELARRGVLDRVGAAEGLLALGDQPVDRGVCRPAQAR